MTLTRKVKVEQLPLDDIEESDYALGILDDPISIEHFILQIQDFKMVQILLLRALGLKYYEIIPLIGVSMGQYYLLVRKLKNEILIWVSK